MIHSGIRFCKEDISLTTIPKFAPLRDLPDWIDMTSCGTAYITPDIGGGYGDGNVPCPRPAQTARAPVRVSTAIQLYDRTTDFGPWEDTVLAYGRSVT